MKINMIKPRSQEKKDYYLFDATTLTQKTRLLEFAAVIVFLLKFKVAFLPDYTLKYLDIETDFSPLYGSIQEESSSADMQTIGSGRALNRRITESDV